MFSLFTYRLMQLGNLVLSAIGQLSKKYSGAFSVYTHIYVLCFSALIACKPEGALKPNQAPTTLISLNKINLQGQSRLISSVQLFWSGSDIDGQIKGFEISFDNQTWNFTTKTDSLFRLAIGPNTDSTDINFYVRAVDNQGLSDPNPAKLRIPIRNSKPLASFQSTAISLADSLYPILSLPWQVSDPDGNQTLDSIFIRANQGPWLALPTSSVMATLAATNMRLVGNTEATLYLNTNGTRYPKALQNIRIGQANRFYIKSRDIAGVFSDTDSTKIYIFRRQRSGLLVLDSHTGAVSPTPKSVLLPILAQISPLGYDYIDLLAGGGSAQPRFWNLEFALLLGKYQKVFWFTDDSRSTNQADNSRLIIETAAPSIQKYMDAGGKLLLSMRFPDGVGRLSRESSIFGILPIDSIPMASADARLNNNSWIIPLQSGHDSLRSTRFLSGVDAFHKSLQSEAVYSANIVSASGVWSGPTTLAARQRFTNGRINLVVFGLELHNLNGNSNKLSNTISNILNNDFNW